ncbi:hypothetical protein SH580_06730 [Coraliomargarita algicola]|uniref:PEP-CTERM protein-sorting domain-containing protein n=1 Tax=Coraliomargarita algicola TaxID=3092156 RepID=A0ABZ0RQM3_9BACT|nr:hypothetical protein [Coraliomargarita sp. J2-16]WPJ97403.1 hypothetical protein SH580_06730 [Coraliomargarita sp. J2-16]
MFRSIPILTFCAASTAYPAINIVLDYGTTSSEDIESYGAAFSSAESFWESQLTGYRDTGLNAPTQVLVNVNLSEIDGAGGVLGSAGPTYGNFGGTFVETTEGDMTFDTVDIDSLVAAGIFDSVIRHELGHVLGLGTLWGLNGVYSSGTGQYTGAAALSAFQIEFDQAGASYIPVELDGGAGTANGHWNMGVDLGTYEEADSRDDPGDGIVYTSINNGLTLDNELMTGYLTGEAWLSNTTLQSFYDIGYEVALDIYGQAVPEPSAFAFILGVGAAFMVVRRRALY